MSEGETSTADAMDDDSVEQEMKEVEENPPDKLEDWPEGKAKYKTFGGPEAESGYGEGATENLSPAAPQPHEAGSVTIEGEKVDTPEDYKGEPIPGGPTDPDAPPDPGFQDEEEKDED